MGEGVLTSGFARVDGALACEGVALERIAREVGTPTYVYSATMIRDRYSRLDSALSVLPHRIHYTLKANSNAGILRLLRELGAGVDIVSGGELYRALRAGFRGEDIVFGGVGKTERELREDWRRAFTCLVAPGAGATEAGPGVAPIHVQSAYEVNPYWQAEEPGEPSMVPAWQWANAASGARSSAENMRSSQDRS